LDEIGNLEEKRFNGRISAEFHVFRNLSLIILLVVIGIRTAGSGATGTYMTSYFVDAWKVDPALASLIFGMSPLVGILASPLGGSMTDKIGEKKWLTLGFVTQVVSLLVIAFSPSLTWIIISYLFYSFFGTMEMPAEQSLIVKLTPASGRGLAFSISFLPGSLMGSVSPVLVALIVEALGIWYIFPYAMFMFSADILLMGLLSRRPETENRVNSPPERLI
jgi:MFS family permease